MSQLLRPLLNDHLAKLSHKLAPRKWARTVLRAQWPCAGGKAGLHVADHFDLTRDTAAGERVDQQTWEDLEFPDIATRLDSTITPIGSQMLYTRMRSYVHSADQLATRYAACQTLRTNAALREAIQLALLPLSDAANADIALGVFGELPAKPRFSALLPIWGLVSLLTLLSVIFLAWPLWIWLAVLAANAVIIFGLYPTLVAGADRVRRCLPLLRVGDALARVPPGSSVIAELAQLGEEKPGRAKAHKVLRWPDVLQLPGIDVAYKLLSFAFLAELIVYLHTFRRFARMRPQLASTFELIGSLDASIAMAAFLERSSIHCAPAFAEPGVLEIARGHHPLIDDPVTNSIQLAKRSALVTGSNMAGKTTFVKMLGVNMIFAQTLGFCLASKATVPRSPVMASIAGRHSVASGKSHYFAEVERIHAFIDSAARGDCQTFIIDELFSGTNTVERLAVCRAVLSALGREAMVLVTSHDVELQALLNEHYQLYHFQENPDVEGFFDFRLHAGAATQRNAIRVLERIGFPADVVTDALAYAGATTPSEVPATDEANNPCVEPLARP